MNYTDMSYNDRISIIENLRVLHPRLTKVINDIDECRRDSRFSTEATSMLLMGETGAGKTTAIKIYSKRNPEILSKEGVIIPVFISSLPSKATIKGVAQRMLGCMNSPRPAYGSTVDLTERLIKLFKACNVEIIILDEFQHLLQRGARNVLEEIGDWIKDLINDSGVPIVLVGMPGSEALLQANSQLERRIGTIETLAPFEHKTGALEYRKFLQTVETGLPFEKESQKIFLGDPKMASRIFLASAGSPAGTMRLIREASRKALLNNEIYLSNQHFSDVFERYFAGRARCGKNPWKVSDGLLVDAIALLEKKGQ